MTFDKALNSIIESSLINNDLFVGKAIYFKFQDYSSNGRRFTIPAECFNFLWLVAREKNNDQEDYAKDFLSHSFAVPLIEPQAF